MRISLIAISFLLLAACSRHDGATRADSARELARSVAAGNFPSDAPRVLQAQLHRELFNAKDTGFVRGLHSCDEGGEEEPPPGLALARATVIGEPLPSRDEPDAVTVRAVLTSAASTRHHEDGDQVDIDVEAQLHRELFNAKDTGFVRGLHSCDEGGEEEPPPGLALARATVIGEPLPSRDEPDAVTVRAVLTSAASTRHHEDGDQVDIDV